MERLKSFAERKIEQGKQVLFPKPVIQIEGLPHENHRLYLQQGLIEGSANEYVMTMLKGEGYQPWFMDTILQLPTSFTPDNSHIAIDHGQTRREFEDRTDHLIDRFLNPDWDSETQGKYIRWVYGTRATALKTPGAKYSEAARVRAAIQVAREQSLRKGLEVSAKVEGKDPNYAILSELLEARKAVQSKDEVIRFFGQLSYRSTIETYVNSPYT